MTIRLRSNTDIYVYGFNIKLDDKTHTIKISHLADDTTLILSSKREIYIAMNEIEKVDSLSGLTLSRNKTEGLLIGKLKHCIDKIESSIG
jgi:hypothetical protein